MLFIVFKTRYDTIFNEKNKDNSVLEKEILLLQEKAKYSPISIGEILNILSEKGQLLIILFLSLPFCQPLQIPGLSAPFGLAIAFIGLKIAFGKRAWLPKRISAKTITPDILQTITEKFLWLLKKMRGWIYPRYVWLCYYPAAQLINGLLISILGLLLALPLPTPFSNLLVAWSILLIGLGLLKDDGLVVFIGYFSSFLTFLYFTAIILLVRLLL